LIEKGRYVLVKKNKLNLTYHKFEIVNQYVLGIFFFLFFFCTIFGKLEGEILIFL